MRDIFEVLAEKEMALGQLRVEIDALKLAIRLIEAVPVATPKTAPVGANVAAPVKAASVSAQQVTAASAAPSVSVPRTFSYSAAASNAPKQFP